MQAIQRIANKYQTDIYVVGSRANNEGKNIYTKLKKGKGDRRRSDIDFKIDGAHKDKRQIIAELDGLNGVGSAELKYDWRKGVDEPFIKFFPD